MSKAEQLWNYIMNVIGLCADTYGHNVQYTVSMDCSYIPDILRLFLTDDDEIDSKQESFLDGLHFLADNGRILPKKLKNASLEEIRDYVYEHDRNILGKIEMAFRIMELDIKGYCPHKKII